MDLFIAFALVVVGLVVLGATGLTFGHDSRESIGDDHRRPSLG